MELIRGLENLRTGHRGSVVTVGNYDGVHRGHQDMLAAVTRRARETGLPATVVTFEPSPREFFEGARAPARLMRLREKVEALALYGIERVRRAAFQCALAGHDRTGLRAAIAARGSRRASRRRRSRLSLRRKRAGTVETLRPPVQRLGFTLQEVDPFLAARRASQQFARARGAGARHSSIARRS